MAFWEGKVRELWPILFVEGTVMIVLGAAAVIMPPLAGLAITILLGWLLIVSAVADAVVTISQAHRPGFWWSLASDGLTFLTGAVLFAWPAGGVISLTLALAIFLTLDGAIAIMVGLAHRRRLLPKWTWLLANGALDIVLAGVIVALLPQAAAWALGLAVGADLLFAGATLVAMALDERGASTVFIAESAQ